MKKGRLFLLARIGCLCLAGLWISPLYAAPSRPPNLDPTYSFLQVVDSNTIRLRNLLDPTTGNLYRADYEMRKGAALSMINGTLALEGTNQRPYAIVKRSITVDGDMSDWTGISPAWVDPAGDAITPELGTDFTEVRLARDDDYLYVLFVLNGDPAPNTGYFFDARMIPEYETFDFRTFASSYGSYLAINYRALLTQSTFPPYPPEQSTIVVTYFNDQSHTWSALGTGCVEWKIPLSDFPLEALKNKYAHVHTWNGSTNGDWVNDAEGVRIVLP